MMVCCGKSPFSRCLRISARAAACSGAGSRSACPAATSASSAHAVFTMWSTGAPAPVRLSSVSCTYFLFWQERYDSPQPPSGICFESRNAVAARSAGHVSYVDPVAIRPFTPNHVPYVKHTAHEPYHDPSERWMDFKKARPRLDARLMSPARASSGKRFANAASACRDAEEHSTYG